MKGVIICAGKSSRLYPATSRLSKQLLPLYDKPLMYYPVSMLMKVGIKDIIIVTNAENEQLFVDQFGTGEQLGVKFTIIVDPNPKGTAAALLVVKDYIKDEKVCFVLGDNFFYGDEFYDKLQKSLELDKGAYVFSYPVKNPSAFGVATLDKNGNVIKLVEKPKNPETNLAVTGIYVYDKKVLSLVEKLEPSARGEYEVTDLNKKYMELGELKLVQLSKKNYWLDAGTPDGMLTAGMKIAKTQKKTKNLIGCLEEVAYQKGYINKEQLSKCYEKLKNSDYGKYILKYLD